MLSDLYSQLRQEKGIQLTIIDSFGHEFLEFEYAGGRCVLDLARLP